jgi:hypothetical protein
MGVIARSFEQAEDTTRFPNGHEHVVEVSGTPVGLATFQPGWRWSNDVRPLVGTESCPFHHVGYILSGVLHVEPNDGPALDIRGGDVYEIAPGHDAWVAGDEACVILDWGGKVREYAQPGEQAME